MWMDVDVAMFTSELHSKTTLKPQTKWAKIKKFYGGNTDLDKFFIKPGVCLVS